MAEETKAVDQQAVEYLLSVINNGELKDTGLKLQAAQAILKFTNDQAYAEIARRDCDKRNA